MSTIIAGHFQPQSAAEEAVAALGAAMGLAAMEELGANAALVAGGVGAYVGSLLGAVGNMHDKPGTSADAARTTNLRRQSGMNPSTLHSASPYPSAGNE